AGPGDALLVVDSNVGFNKVDDAIDRQAEYAVQIEPTGSAVATLTLTYTNRSAANGEACILRPYFPPQYAELQQGCYWNYARVLGPAGSQLLTSSGEWLVEIKPETPSRTTWGAYFVLPRGATRTLSLQYRVPRVLDDKGNYSLRVEKQPGAGSMPVTVRVSWPERWALRAFEPGSARVETQMYEARLVLDRDRVVSLGLGPGSLFARTLELAVGGVLLIGLGLRMYRR
ncbi:MAG TPA: hypothetical protein VIV15_15140, partial [Anaerolineales bacterium]